MKRILAVVNPIAGKKRKVNPEQMVQEVLPNSVFVEWLYWSSVEMDIGLETINRLNSDTFDMVVVFGGDGTVNRIARAMLHRKEALLIIPLGSGNGLARHLKIPMNPKKALSLALNTTITPIDAVKINNEFYFCSAGLGFDALIAYKFAHAGTRGLKTYIKMVFNEFFHYKSKKYIISTPNEQINTKAFFITVANANQWGNNVKVAPQANIDDGQLEVTILKPFLWIELPLILLSLFFNRFNRSYKVKAIRTPKVEISSTELQNYAHYDGEPLVIGQNASFYCIPKSLNMVIGRKMIR